VGFLGDGINDAPALKRAGVALAVDAASDIARSASDIVLFDRSLGVIIGGIRGGREIFANMVKYLKITLISNFGNFFAIALAMLISPFLPLLPVQILLLNLLTDTPMIAISFDAVDTRELRKPKTYNVKEIILMAVIFGCIHMLFVLGFFFLFSGEIPAVIQTNLFLGSVLVELLLIFSIRTKRVFYKGAPPSKTLLALCALPVVFAFGLPFTGIGKAAFHFVEPLPEHLVLITGVGLLYFLTMELCKALYYRIASRRRLAVN
jgi:Mg2+-importing ATPase